MTTISGAVIISFQQAEGSDLGLKAKMIEPKNVVAEGKNKWMKLVGLKRIGLIFIGRVKKPSLFFKISQDQSTRDPHLSMQFFRTSRTHKVSLGRRFKGFLQHATIIVLPCIDADVVT